jgi:hypothetical protein
VSKFIVYLCFNQFVNIRYLLKSSTLNIFIGLFNTFQVRKKISALEPFQLLKTLLLIIIVTGTFTFGLFGSLLSKTIIINMIPKFESAV